MAKVLTAEQIRSVDQYTIKHEPIPSIDLMERAATQCFNVILEQHGEHSFFHVFCGTGNNGGDGLVIARLLSQAGKQVVVSIVHFSPNQSSDFSINLDRLSDTNVTINSVTNIGELHTPKGVLIDALLGSGVTRKVSGLLEEVIIEMNQSKKPIISIDFPSGMFDRNNTSENRDCAVKAEYTLTFQVPKLAFLLPENEENIGNWQIIDIGLNKTFINSLPSVFTTTELYDVREMVHRRSPFSHKGTHGHGLLIGGSVGKMGAITMASQSALRSGVGLLSVLAPKCGYNILQTSVPEAMAIPTNDENYIHHTIELDKYSAVGIGPGMDTHEETATFLHSTLNEISNPLVLDADALNLISKNKELLTLLPAQTILTPHPKEFDRLFGDSPSTFERIKLAQEAAKKYSIIIVLKGHYTAVVLPDGNVNFNTSGNPGMATGGSGDVLTGILTGLLAQGYSAADTAVIGCFLHGLAGDLATEQESEESMIASDIIHHIGSAFKLIHQE